MRKPSLLLLAAMTSLSTMAQRDITSTYITNPTLATNTNGWTNVNFNTPEQGNNTIGWASEAYAGWDKLTLREYSLTQTITLPRGHYRLANYSFYRQGAKATDNKEKSLAYLKAGDQRVAIKTLGSITPESYANNQAEGANCFDSKMYRNVVEFDVASDNTPIEIGLEGTFDEMRSWMIAGMFELFDLDQLPTEDVPTDVTYAITNSGFEYRNTGGWTMTPTNAFAHQVNNDFAGKAGGYYGERWQASGGLSDCSIEQTLTDMPAGYYTLSAKVKYNGTGASIYANDAQTAITANQLDRYAVRKKIQRGDDLTIGIRVNSGTGNWIAFDQFQLTYYPIDLTSLKAKFAQLRTEAEALMAQPMYDDALAALQAATVPPIDDEDAYIATNEALEAAIPAAKASIQQYAIDHLTEGSSIDFTHKLKNPDFEQGDQGWDKTQNQTGGGSWGVVEEDGNNIFQSTYNNYMRHETIYQEGITLPAGTYRLSARLKGQPKDDLSTYIYATDGGVNHWANPVFAGNTWYGYLKRIAGGEWTTTELFFTLKAVTTMRIGVLSWGNNWQDGIGGAFAIDDWHLEMVKTANPKHMLGDVTGTGRVDARDVALLVDALQNGTTDALYDGADANNDYTIDAADVHAAATQALATTPTLASPAPVYNMVVYAEQSNAENKLGDTYQLASVLYGDKSAISSVGRAVTTLNIGIEGIANVESVSIAASDRHQIAGAMTYDTKFKNYAAAMKPAPSAYAKGMESDVVTVRNDDATTTFTAYLMPTQLTQGITVTVTTTDGKRYAEDFPTINAGEANTLTFTSQTESSNWMATIPGNTYFGMVSTPGAHDACTRGSSFGTSAECQDLTLEEQLAAGVRQFDLRPGYFYTETITEDNLYIYHGQICTDILYRDAIKTLVDFLEQHPTEALSIVMVKENNKPFIGSNWTDRSSEMWAVINAVQERYKDRMKILDNANATLSDYRGKIAYVNRTGTTVPYTTRITNWPDNATVSNYACEVGPFRANVQDAYNKNGTNKQTEVKSMLDLSTADTDHTHLYYNYLSSANSPKTYAKATNPVIATYLADITGPVGYLLADYIGSTSVSGGSDLLRAIIAQNQKYVFEGRTRVTK